jgi:hypothetical protein
LKVEVDWSSRGQKDFICREEKGWMWACSRTWKPVVPWVKLEIGFYSFFLYCPRAEMSLRSKQTLPGKKCLLGWLSPFGTSCSLPFNQTPQAEILASAQAVNQEQTAAGREARCLWTGHRRTENQQAGAKPRPACAEVVLISNLAALEWYGKVSGWPVTNPSLCLRMITRKWHDVWEMQNITMHHSSKIKKQKGELMKKYCF